MNKRYLTMCFSVLSVVHPMTVYSEPIPSDMVARRNDYKKPIFKRGADSVALNKAARFLSYLGMSVDYEQDDIELAIANWMAIPENHQLFFEEICKKIHEEGDICLRNTLLPALEELSHKWSELAKRWVLNDSLTMKIGFVLCSDPDEKNPAQEKREEANELFIEAAKDIAMGSIAAVEVIIAIEVFPILAVEPAERVYENLSDAWDKIHKSAEAYREAERLEREENSEKKDNR